MSLLHHESLRQVFSVSKTSKGVSYPDFGRIEARLAHMGDALHLGEGHNALASKRGDFPALLRAKEQER
jgi:hypothetical protein